MKEVLTRAELAKRWSVDVKTIANWEKEGIIQRIDTIPLPRYSLEFIMKIEGINEINKFSPLERQRLENEVKELIKDNNILRNILNNIFIECSKYIKYKS